MKNVAASLLIAVALVTTSALAKEQYGVKMPDTTTVEGQELKLKGMGLRKKFIFDVYVAGLYLSEPAQDPLADQTKQVKLVMMRDLGPDKVGEAIRDGFKANPDNDMASLKPRLDKLIGALPEVKKGEALVITYVPEKSSTQLSSGGKELVTIEGKDFGTALFAVWLGKHPVNDGLKKDMLGQN